MSTICGQPHEVLDIFSDVASPDAQKCESVTVERVEMCMARLTGVMPETRMAGNFQVVETSIGGQFLDIEVAENELRFTGLTPGKWTRRGLAMLL